MQTSIDAGMGSNPGIADKFRRHRVLALLSVYWRVTKVLQLYLYDSDVLRALEWSILESTTDILRKFALGVGVSVRVSLAEMLGLDWKASASFKTSSPVITVFAFTFVLPSRDAPRSFCHLHLHLMSIRLFQLQAFSRGPWQILLQFSWNLKDFQTLVHAN